MLIQKDSDSILCKVAKQATWYRRNMEKKIFEHRVSLIPHLSSLNAWTIQSAFSSCNVLKILALTTSLLANPVDAQIYQLLPLLMTITARGACTTTPRCSSPMRMRMRMATQDLFQLRRQQITNHNHSEKAEAESPTTRGACAPRGINNVVCQLQSQGQEYKQQKDEEEGQDESITLSYSCLCCWQSKLPCEATKSS